MTQVATLPDPLEEVAPPRGRSGGAAWAIWLARRVGLAALTLWLVSILVFLATVVIVCLSWYLVEQPILQGRWGRGQRRTPGTPAEPVTVAAAD